jgi:hypothetical protein
LTGPRLSVAPRPSGDRGGGCLTGSPLAAGLNPAIAACREAKELEVSKPKDAPAAPQEVLPPLSGKGGRAAKGKGEDERDHELEGLMADIEADLREEELRKLWARYGKFVIAAVVIMILAVAGVQLWRQRAEEQRAELASRYEQALKDLQAGKTDDAAGILADVAGRRGEGYAVLAQFQRAALALQNNDTAGAVAIYKDVAADAKVDRSFRDLALVLKALHTLDTADPKALEAELAALTGPANPFRPTALELSSLLAAKQGDIARAAQIAQQLRDDPATPQSMRTRVEDLAAYYKTLDSVAPPAAKP